MAQRAVGDVGQKIAKKWGRRCKNAKIEITLGLGPIKKFRVDVERCNEKGLLVFRFTTICQKMK